jgi:hypothetical protein
VVLGRDVFQAAATTSTAVAESKAATTTIGNIFRMAASFINFKK